MKKKYKVKSAGWVLGELRKKGATVEATDREAQYLVMNGTLELSEAAKEAEGATAAAAETEAADKGRRR